MILFLVLSSIRNRIVRQYVMVAAMKLDIRDHISMVGHDSEVVVPDIKASLRSEVDKALISYPLGLLLLDTLQYTITNHFLQGFRSLCQGVGAGRGGAGHVGHLTGEGGREEV